MASASFVLSKIFFAIAQPGSLLLWLILLSWLLVRRRPLLSRALLGTVAIGLALLSLSPLPYALVHPLEMRFPQPKLPTHIDGIIVLGGAIDAAGSAAAGSTQINASAERLTAFAALARRYPDARLVYSGGSGAVLDQTHREADYARPLLESIGVDVSRIAFERESRNTWENALDSLQMVAPGRGEVWLLITSAWHMPRSVGCFRRVGWQVVPYPVDFLTAGAPEWGGFDFSDGLDLTTIGFKEWIGLIAYHLMGRSDDWFPGIQ